MDDYEIDRGLLPDHPFFESESSLGFVKCSSFYLIPLSLFKYREEKYTGDHLVFRCDFKNYENNIQLFLDWIEPYIEDREKETHIGHFRYEENTYPTLIFHDGKKFVFRRVQK